MAFIPPVNPLPLRLGHATSFKSPTSSPPITTAKPRAMVRASTIVEKGAGMRIIQSADEDTIARLGCRSWSKWGCVPSTFPWAYDADEVALVLEGEFSVIPDDGSEKMDVVAGDVVYFPKGMSCTWEVRKTVEKLFAFGKKL